MLGVSVPARNIHSQSFLRFESLSTLFIVFSDCIVGGTSNHLGVGDYTLNEKYVGQCLLTTEVIYIISTVWHSCGSFWVLKFWKLECWGGQERGESSVNSPQRRLKSSKGLLSKKFGFHGINFGSSMWVFRDVDIFQERNVGPLIASDPSAFPPSKLLSENVGICFDDAVGVGHDPKLRSDVMLWISFWNCNTTIVLGCMVLYDR